LDNSENKSSESEGKLAVMLILSVLFTLSKISQGGHFRDNTTHENNIGDVFY